MTISSRLNFGRLAPPGRGSAAGRIFLAPQLLQPARSVCVSLSVFFSLFLVEEEFVIMFVILGVYWF